MKRVLLGVLLASLVGLLAALVPARTWLGHASRHDQMARQARALMAADNALDQEVLQSRAELVMHFDRVAGAVDQVRLAMVPTTGWAQDPCVLPVEKEALELRLAELAAAVEAKQGLVERFKAETAVLRNSQRYLPVATRELLQRGPPGSARDQRDAQLGLLERDLALVAMGADSEDAVRLDQAIGAASKLTTGLDAADRKKLELMLRHARVILERRPQVDHRVHEMLRLSVRERVERLRQWAWAHTARVEREMEGRIRLLVGMALLAFAAGMAFLRVQARGARVGGSPPAAGSPGAPRECADALVVAVRLHELENASRALPAADLQRVLDRAQAVCRTALEPAGAVAVSAAPGEWMAWVPADKAPALARLVAGLASGLARLEWEPGEPVEPVVVLHRGQVVEHAAGAWLLGEGAQRAREVAARAQPGTWSTSHARPLAGSIGADPPAHVMLASAEPVTLHPLGPPPGGAA